MQFAAAIASSTFVPPEWLARLPAAPVASSGPLGWQRMSVLRVRFPEKFHLDLPAVNGPFISAHLRHPCELSARWNGTSRRCRSLPGEAIIMNAYHENSWVGSGELDELHVFLDPLLLREAGAEFADRRVELIEGIGIRDPIISTIASRLVEELEGPGTCSRLVGSALAQALVAQLLSRHSTLRPVASFERIDMPKHKVRAAVDYIETHLGDDVCIDSIAAAVGMSPFRFARGFARGTGQAPHQFVLARRIEHAKDLLRTSDRSLADIARSVGFSTQSHFTVAFRKRCQMTPLVYRRAARGEA